MLDWLRFILVALCFISGTVILFISLFGSFRLGYALNRLHAAAITDTLVLLLFAIGCIIAAGIDIASIKIVLVVFIQWCTSPLVSHMFVKAKVTTDENLKLHCTLPEEDMASLNADCKEEQ